MKNTQTQARDLVDTLKRVYKKDLDLTRDVDELSQQVDHPRHIQTAMLLHVDKSIGFEQSLSECHDVLLGIEKYFDYSRDVINNWRKEQGANDE